MWRIRAVGLSTVIRGRQASLLRPSRPLLRPRPLRSVKIRRWKPDEKEKREAERKFWAKHFALLRRHFKIWKITTTMATIRWKFSFWSATTKKPIYLLVRRLSDEPDFRMTKRQFFSSLSESCRCCCWCCCCCCCKLCCCKCCCCCYCCCQRWRGWRRFCLPRSTSWIFILTHSSIPPESVSLQKATIFSIKFFWRAPLTSYFCFYLFFNSSVTGSQKRNEATEAT